MPHVAQTPQDLRGHWQTWLGARSLEEFANDLSGLRFRSHKIRLRVFIEAACSQELLKLKASRASVGPLSKVNDAA